MTENMTEKDVLLIMTLLDLLGKPADPKDIADAYKRQKQAVDKLREEDPPNYQVMFL